MLQCSPCQIVVIHEPRPDNPDLLVVSEFKVYPDAVLDMFIDGHLTHSGQINSCVPVETTETV